MAKSLTLHVLSDLPGTWPPFLAANLRQYCIGQNGLTSSKFASITDRMKNALGTSPPNQQAAYIMECLKFSAFVYGPTGETLNKLFMTLLSRLKTSVCQAKKIKSTNYGDGGSGKHEREVSFDGYYEAKKLASQLVSVMILGLTSLSESVSSNDQFVHSLATLFLIEMSQLREVTVDPKMFEELEKGTEQIILRLASCRDQKRTEAMLERFPLKDSTCREFLAFMVSQNQIEVAEHLATLFGQTMLSFLVEQCSHQKNERMLKTAHRIVKRHNLEFPEVYLLNKELLFMEDVEKGNLKKALLDAGNDTELAKRLRTRARNIGYVEEEVVSDTGCLRLEDFVSKDNVIWIDTREGLYDAATQFAGVGMVGIDTEWILKSWKEKGSNKISILQVATEKNVLIFDMIKLYHTAPQALNDCLKPVFRCRDVVKLGYALNCDLHLLFMCYGDLECFKICEGCLDLQKFSATPKGGLSGLAKDVLGAHLDKGAQTTDWALRPLDNGQLQYAALDAVVLIAIFHKAFSKPDKPDDWKSKIDCWEPSKKVQQCREKYHKTNLSGISMLRELADNRVDGGCLGQM